MLLRVIGLFIYENLPVGDEPIDHIKNRFVYFYRYVAKSYRCQKLISQLAQLISNLTIVFERFLYGWLSGCFLNID